MSKKLNDLQIKGVKELISELAKFPVLEDGNFRSHQEYADYLMNIFLEYQQSCSKKPTDKELVDLVHSTMKMKYGYEYAVLRDLGMADHSGHFHIQFIRNWLFQAWSLQGKPVPYNFLIQIAYGWMEQVDRDKYTISLSGDIPEKALKRPKPPKPKWLKILEQPLPKDSNYNTMLTFAKEYGNMATSMKDIFHIRYANYYMACNEPGLLDYNFRLLTDKYRNESDENYNARIERYIFVYEGLAKEVHKYIKSIKEKFDVILEWLESEATKKMGVEYVKSINNFENMFEDEDEKDPREVNFF